MRQRALRSMALLCVIASSAVVPLHSQSTMSPVLELGGDVVDGKLAAYKFYDAAVVTFHVSNAHWDTGVDIDTGDGDTCTSFAGSGGQWSSELLDDGELSLLLTAPSLCDGSSNPSWEEDASGRGYLSVTYQASSADIVINEDTPLLFTFANYQAYLTRRKSAPGDWVGDDLDSETPTATISVVSHTYPESSPTPFCSMSLADGYSYDISFMTGGGLKLDIFTPLVGYMSSAVSGADAIVTDGGWISDGFKWDDIAFTSDDLQLVGMSLGTFTDDGGDFIGVKGEDSGGVIAEWKAGYSLMNTGTRAVVSLVDGQPWVFGLTESPYVAQATVYFPSPAAGPAVNGADVTEAFGVVHTGAEQLSGSGAAGMAMDGVVDTAAFGKGVTVGVAVVADPDDVNCAGAVAVHVGAIAENEPLTFVGQSTRTLFPASCNFDVVSMDAIEITGAVFKEDSDNVLEWGDGSGPNVDVDEGDWFVVYVDLDNDTGTDTDSGFFVARALNSLTQDTSGTVELSLTSLEASDGTDVTVDAQDDALCVMKVSATFVSYGAQLTVPATENMEIFAQEIVELVVPTDATWVIPTHQSQSLQVVCEGSLVLVEPNCEFTIKTGEHFADVDENIDARAREVHTVTENELLWMSFTLTNSVYFWHDYLLQRDDETFVEIIGSESTPLGYGWNDIVWNSDLYAETTPGKPQPLAGHRVDSGGELSHISSAALGAFVGESALAVVTDTTTTPSVGGWLSGIVAPDGSRGVVLDGSLTVDQGDAYPLGMTDDVVTFVATADGDKAVDGVDPLSFLGSSTTGTVSEGDLLVTDGLYSLSGDGVAPCQPLLTNSGIFRVDNVVGDTITSVREWSDGDCASSDGEEVALRRLDTTPITIDTNDYFEFDIDPPYKLIFDSNQHLLYPGDVIYLDCFADDNGERVYSYAIGQITSVSVDGLTYETNIHSWSFHHVDEVSVNIGGCDGSAESKLSIDVLHVLEATALQVWGNTAEDYWTEQDVDVTLELNTVFLKGSLGLDCVHTLVTPSYRVVREKLTDEEGVVVEGGGYDDNDWAHYANYAVTEAMVNSGSLFVKTALDAGEELTSDDGDGPGCAAVLAGMTGEMDDGSGTLVASETWEMLVNTTASASCEIDDGIAQVTFHPEDFELTDVTTISMSIELTDAEMLFLTSPYPINTTWTSTDTLLVYPDGYIDPPSDVTFDSRGEVWWTFGFHLYDIAYSLLSCDFDCEDCFHTAIPPTVPMIHHLTDLTDFRRLHDTPTEGDVCRLVVGDVMGNVMSKHITCETLTAPNPRPEFVVATVLDSAGLTPGSQDEIVEGWQAFAPVDSVDGDVVTLSDGDSGQTYNMRAGTVVKIVFEDEDLNDGHGDAFGVVSADLSEGTTVTLTEAVEFDRQSTAGGTLYLWTPRMEAVFSTPATYSDEYEAGGELEWSLVDLNDPASTHLADMSVIGHDAENAIHSADHSVKGQDFTLPQLVYGREYELKVVQSTNGDSDYTVDIAIPKMFPLTFSVPAPVGMPFVESRGSTSLTLRWRRSPGDGGYPIESYTLQCVNGNELTPEWSEWQDDSIVVSKTVTATDATGCVIPRATVHGLTAATKYTCRVVATTAYGESFGFVNGLQPNAIASDCGGTALSVVKTTDNNAVDTYTISQGDSGLSSCVGDDSGMFGVEIKGQYRWVYLDSDGVGHLDSPLEVEDEEGNPLVQEGDAVMHTRHIFTNAVDSSAAAQPHPLSSVLVTQSASEDGVKLDFSWTVDEDEGPEEDSTAETTKCYELDFYVVNPDAAEEYMLAEVDCLAGDILSYSVCGFGDGSDEELTANDASNAGCHMLLPSSALPRGAWVGMYIRPVAASGLSGLENEVWVYVHGTVIDDDDVTLDGALVGTCGPARPSLFDLDSNPEKYLSDKVHDSFVSASLVGESVVAGDAPGALWDFEWVVEDVNRDAAYVTIPRPCLYYSDGAVKMMSGVEVHMDGTDSFDEVTSPYLDYRLWFDDEGDEMEFQPTGLQELTLYDGVIAVGLGVDGEGKCQPNSYSGFVGPDTFASLTTHTLPWVSMWPLKMSAPSLSLADEVVEDDEGLLLSSSSDTIVIKWLPPASDGGSPVRYYQISMREDVSAFTLVQVDGDDDDADADSYKFAVTYFTPDEDLTYTMTGLVPATTYQFRVRACNRQVFNVEDAEGRARPYCSRWSNPTSIATDSPRNAPATPSISVDVTAVASLVTVSFSETMLNDLERPKYVALNAMCLLSTADAGLPVAEDNTFPLDSGMQESSLSQRVGLASLTDQGVHTPGVYWSGENSISFATFTGLSVGANYFCNLVSWDTYGRRYSTAFDFSTANTMATSLPLAPLAISVNLEDEVVYFLAPIWEDEGLQLCDVMITNAEIDGSCPNPATLIETTPGVSLIPNRVYGPEEGEVASTPLYYLLLDEVAGGETEDGTGLNKEFCANVQCQVEDDLLSPFMATGEGAHFVNFPSPPSDDTGLVFLDQTDRAALVMFTAPSSSGGAEVEQYHLYCSDDSGDNDDVSASVHVASFHRDGDGSDGTSLVLEAHFSDFEPSTTYTCYAAAENSVGISPEEGALTPSESDHAASFTTEEDTGGVDGIRRLSISPRRPFISSEGTAVTGQWADGAGNAEEVLVRRVPVTHQSIRVEWEPLCTTANDASQCLGSNDNNYVDDSEAGSEATAYDRTTSSDMDDNDGNDDVSLVATILRFKPILPASESDAWTYLWYEYSSSANGVTGETELTDLFGGTEYSFQVAHVSNYLGLLRTTTLDGLEWSSTLSLFTEAASAPDMALPVYARDEDDTTSFNSGAHWHTTDALFVDLAEFGDGYETISPNGAVVTKFEVQCRSSSTSHWEDSNLTLKKVEGETPPVQVSLASRHPRTTTSLFSGQVDSSAAVLGYEVSHNPVNNVCRSRVTSASGVGSWSHIYSEESADEVAPSATTSRPLRMKRVMVTEVTSSSVTLAWTPPAAEGGQIIVGYLISGGRWGDVIVGAGVEEVEVTGLLPYTEYSFTVQAYNTLYYGCNSKDTVVPTGISVPSEPQGVRTSLVDDSIGQVGSIDIWADIFPTPGSTTCMIEWGVTAVTEERSDGLDGVTGLRVLSWGHTSEPVVDIEIATVDDESDALEWDSMDKLYPNMWWHEESSQVVQGSAGGVRAGWVKHPFRYITQLAADTTYALRFAARTQPSHPLGASAPILISYSSYETFTTEPEAVPMPPLPVSRSGLDVVVADTDLPLELLEGETDAERERWIKFDIGEGYPSPELGATSGSFAHGYYVVISGNVGRPSPSSARVVDTSLHNGHWPSDNVNAAGDSISSISTLLPNTEYRFEVSYSDTLGNKGPSFDHFVTQTSSCSRIESPINVRVLSIRSAAALVSWSEPDTHGANIDRYEIRCWTDPEMTQGLVKQTNIPSDWTSWYIDGLRSGTEYYCGVFARAPTLTSGCDSLVDSSQVIGLETASVEGVDPLQSLPPYIPRCEQMDTEGLRSSTVQPHMSPSSVEIAWPSFSSSMLRGAGADEFGHDLEFKTSNEIDYTRVLTETTSTITTVTGLNYNTVYHFRVRAVGTLGVGEWSNTFVYSPVTFSDVTEAEWAEGDTTSIRPPDAPSDLRIYDMKRASLLLSWSVADMGSSEVTQVEVRCKRGPVVGDDTDDFPFGTIVDRLTFQEEYQSGGDETTFLASNAAVKLVYEPNVRAPSEFDAEMFGLTADDSFHYFCQARARNRAGWSQWSSVAATAEALPTEQGFPLACPRATLVEVDESSATIRYYPSDDNDGSTVRRYRIVLEEEDSGEVVGERALAEEDFDASLGADESSDVDDGWSRHVDITYEGLRSGVRHIAVIYATNRYEFVTLESPWSLPSPQLQFATVAAERPNFATFQFIDTLETMTGFTWETPNSNSDKSPITEVKLMCDEASYLLDDSGAIIEELHQSEQQPFLGDIQTIVCETADECSEGWRRTFAAGGFERSTTYWCVLAVSNVVGTTVGPTYTFKRMETLGEDSGTSNKLPLYYPPTVTSTTATTASLEWTHPFHSDGLSYSFYDDSNQWDTDDTSITLDDLQPNTSYKIGFFTRGIVSDLRGEYASQVEFITAIDAPPIVRGLSVVATNCDGALLQWERMLDDASAGDEAFPDEGHGITGYSISCDDSTTGATVTRGAFEPSVAADSDANVQGWQGYISGLRPDTFFRCSVRAHNDVGDGEWSTPVSAKTPAIDDQECYLPIPSLQPMSPQSNTLSGDLPSLLDDTVVMPTQIPLAFGLEVTAAGSHYADGLGNSAGVGTTTVVGYRVRWRMADDVGDEEYHHLFVHGGSDLEVSSTEQLYIFTGLQGGTAYVFQVASVTQGADDFERREPELWSAAAIVTTAPYALPDTPELPVLVDVSEEVALLWIGTHDNGSPNNSTRTVTMLCRVDDNTDYTVSGSSKVNSGYVYVRLPVSDGDDDAHDGWRCKARVETASTWGHESVEQVVISSWSYDSWVVQLTEDGERLAPLMALPPSQIRATSDSATVIIYPPPVAGGLTTPSVSMISLIWMEDASYQVLSEIQKRDISRFPNQITRTLSEWCAASESDPPSCTDEGLLGMGTDVDDQSFVITVTGLAGSTGYRFAVAAHAGSVATFDSLSDTAVVRTTTADRPSAVEEFCFVDSTESAFLFEWKSPATNGSPITEFQVECADGHLPLYPGDVSGGEVFTSTLDVSSLPDGDVAESGEIWQYWIAVEEAEITSTHVPHYSCRIITKNSYGTTVGPELNEVPVRCDGDSPGGVVMTTLERPTPRETPLQLVAPRFGSSAATDMTFLVDQGPDGDFHSFYRVKRWLGYRSVEAASNGTALSTDIINASEFIAVDELLPNTPYYFTMQATMSPQSANDLTDGDFGPESVVFGPFWTAAGGPSKKSQLQLELQFEGNDVEAFPCEDSLEVLCDVETGPLAGAGLTFIPSTCLGECYVGSVLVSLEALLDDSSGFLDVNFSSDAVISEVESSSSLISTTGGAMASTTTASVDNAVVAVSVTNDAAFLTWPTPDDGGSGITRAEIDCSAQDDDGVFPFSGQLLYAADLERPVGSTVLSEDGAPIPNLEPSKNYTCRVSFFNDKGVYEATDIDNGQVFRTLDIGDIAPPLRMYRPDVSAVTPTSATLSVTPPASFGGIFEDGLPVTSVSGYTVWYELTNQEDSQTEIYFEGDGSQLEITGLRGGETYSFAVAAQNLVSLDAGERNTFEDASDIVVATLEPTTPSTPSALTGVSNSISSIAITMGGLGDDGLRIDGGIPIDRYVVKFAEVRSEHTNTTLDKLDYSTLPSNFLFPVEGIDVYPLRVEVGGSRVNIERTVIVDNLSDSVVGYAFRYAAVNELGVGEWSAPVLLHTTVRVPDVLDGSLVQLTNVDEDTHGGLQLDFPPPESDGGAEIISYTVTLQELEGPSKSTTTLDFPIGDITTTTIDVTSITGVTTSETVHSIVLTAEAPGNLVYRGGLYQISLSSTNVVGTSPSSSFTSSITITAGDPYAPDQYTLTAWLAVGANNGAVEKANADEIVVISRGSRDGRQLVYSPHGRGRGLVDGSSEDEDTFSGQTSTPWRLEVWLGLGWHGGSSYVEATVSMLDADGETVTLLDNDLSDSESLSNFYNLQPSQSYFLSATISTEEGKVEVYDSIYTSTEGIDKAVGIVDHVSTGTGGTEDGSTTSANGSFIEIVGPSMASQPYIFLTLMLSVLLLSLTSI